MRYIDCFVSDEYVKGAGVPVGAAGSHHDVVIRFSFGSMWDGLTKSITWLNSRGQNPAITYITEDLRVAGAEMPTYEVPIPAEPKEFAGNMSCSIKGVDVSGSQETLATLSVTCEFKVLPSKYSRETVIQLSPNATIADQIQHQFTQIAAQLEQTTLNANATKEYRDQAEDYKNTALSYSSSSYTYAMQSFRDANDAHKSAQNAELSSMSAKDYASRASESATSASESSDRAVQAESSALDSLEATNEARDSAINAETRANNYASNASVYSADALRYAQIAQAASDGAEQYAQSAEASKYEAKRSADDAVFRAQESAMNLTASAQARSAAEKARDEAAESATLAYNHSVLANSYAHQADEASASAMQSAQEAANTLSSKVSKYTYRYDGGGELKTESGIVVNGSEFKNILSRITSNENVTVLMYAGMMIARPTSATNGVIVFTDAFYDAGASTNKQASLVVSYVDDRSPVQCSIVTSNMEVSSNKVNIISDVNKDSKTFYPSVNAVTGYVDPIAEKVTDVESSVGELKQDKADKSEVELLRKKNAEQDYEIEVLKAVTKGIDWIEHEDASEAMVKTVPSGAEGVQIDSVGAKSVVWNQVLNSVAGSRTEYGVTTYALGTHLEARGVATATGGKLIDGTILKRGHKYLFTATNKDFGYMIDNATYSDVGGRVVYTSSLDGTISIRKKIATGVEYDVSTEMYCIDLTIMGYDDITSIDDQRIAWIENYAELHPEYNSGEIVDGVIDSVVNRGANLYSTEDLVEIFRNRLVLAGDSEGAIVHWNCSDSSSRIIMDDFEPNTQYTFKFYGKCENDSAVVSNMVVVYSDGTTLYPSFSTAGKMSYCEYTTPAGKSIKSLKTTWGSVGTRIDLSMSSVCKGVASVPYKSETIDLAALVSKYFPNGMHGVGTAVDHFDFERMKAVHKFREVDMGIMNWNMYDSGTMYSSYVTSLAKPLGQIINARYRAGNGSDGQAQVENGTMSFNINSILRVKDASYTTAQDFKASVAGLTLVYELATPIETDLDPADVPMLKMLVEAGGTLTFNNDALLDIPSKVTYAVKTGGVA